MIRQAMDWIDQGGGWTDALMIGGMLLIVALLWRPRRAR
jgi:hypothetical protein